MKIENLIDNKQYINQVANWLYKEFVEGIKTDVSLESIIVRLNKDARDDYPLTLIAIENEKCIGTITLFENDLKTMDLSPWLGALYIEESNRGRGIAKLLMSELENLTKCLECETLYLRTEHASEYYKKLGWEFMLSTKDEHNIDTEVFRKEL